MNRVYRYILTHDHGIAPCPARGLITLATCKPVIRRVARPGDWVLGFRPGSLERGLLLWAGRVAQVLPHGEYQRRHPNRSDAQYEEQPGGGFKRIYPDYHPTESEMRRDLSAPVLLFDPAASRYLGGTPVPLSVTLAHLAAAGRGHQVNGVVEGDVARLEVWVAGLMPDGVAISRLSVGGCDRRMRARPRAGCG